MDVVKFSQKTKREAQELLKYGNVVEVLSKYGKVNLTGSYSYDLMWGPDIDLVVLSDEPEKASVNALKDFIKLRKFQKYQLGDFSKFPRPGRPQAMIVVLIHEYQGRRWEIEIWFQKSLSKDNEHFNKLLTSASSEQRKTILELKQQREESDISKNVVDSMKIYKSVLSEGKSQYE